MNYNKYPIYKDSGIAWLGEIPEHWEVIKNKYFFKEVNKRSLDGKEILLSMSKIKGLVPRSELKNNKLLRQNFIGYKICKTNDIVLNKLQGWNGMFGLSKLTGIVSPDYTVLRKNEYYSFEINTKYYTYLFTSPLHYVNEFRTVSRGIGDGFFRLYTPEFYNSFSVSPPLSEQTTIANFLDYKLEKIDRFITKKNALIALLNEQKAAIINQAVTTGVPPSNDELLMMNDELDDNNSKFITHNSQFKDSGIEWLGDIPESWEVRKLKFVCYLQRGHDLSKEKFAEGNIPVYGSNGIIGYHDTMTTKSPCITVGRSGSVGKVQLVTKDFWAHNTCLYVKRSFGNNWKYLYHILNTIDIAMVSNGSAVPTLDRKNVHDLFIAYPNKKEQKKLVAFIETETTKIEKTITTIQKEITLVEEYKTALIAETVTGKIDVRKWSEPLILE